MQCGRKRHLVAACIVMSSCASSGGPAADVPLSAATVQPWPSGVSLMFSDAGGHTSLIIDVHGYDGRNERILWQIPDVQALPAYKVLAACVEDVRVKAPKDLRAAVSRCVDSSRMPAPEVISQPDATEYRVFITVGILGARRRLRLTSSNTSPVAADVDQCMGQAEGRGVAIQPLLGRFDTCMRKRAYLVDEPPAKGG
jgi:hypothetical protein